MKRQLSAALVGAAVCLVANGAMAQIQWNGSTSADPLNGANWDGGVAPGSGVQARIGGSPQAPDFAGQTTTWGQFYTNVSNHVGDTGGGGVLHLDGAPDSQFFSEGNELSTIDVDIVATKNIQTNGSHSVIFNGDLTVRKIEAFGGSVATLNGKVTQTDEFMSIGGGSKIVINNEFYWANNNRGINNSPVIELGAGAKFFRPDGSGGWLAGLDVFNVYDGAIVRLAADNAFGTSGETDLWTRNTTNTFDLNGFDQFVEFFGVGDGPAALKIDFGAVNAPNKLIWDAAAGLNGPGGFTVLNFQPGIDTLELGQYGDNNGFHNPAILNRIKINGASYKAANPGPGIPWWTAVATPDGNDDPGRQIAVYHVPEPGSLALAVLATVAASFVRRKTVLR